jgi:ABC-type amino acid transport substrate-binding protein
MQDGDVGGVTFTKPYVSGFGYSLITSRTSSISSVASVGSKRVGVLAGDPDVITYVKNTFPEAEIIELSDALIDGKRTWIADAFKNGVVDALVYDYPFAVAEIKGTSLQFAVSKLPGSDIAYKIGVRVSDSTLNAKLNDAIDKIVETEEYRELLRKYFTSDKITATRKKSGENTYTVQRGDTLSTIAERVYNDRMKYTIIESRNNLPNPNLISVGQVLVIPVI